jgi:hypothetical protein
VPCHRLLVRNLRACIGPLDVPLLRETLDDRHRLADLLASELVQARRQGRPHQNRDKHAHRQP